MSCIRRHAGTNPARAPVLACLVALLFGTSAGAAERERQVRDVSGFDRLEVEGSGEMVISQGDTESLVVEAEPQVLEAITTSVANGVLKIGRAPGARIPASSPIRFELTVRTLEGMTMAGSASVVLAKLHTDQLRVTISGSSHVDVEQLRTHELDVNILGSGTLDVNAMNGDELHTRIGGSGSVRIAGTVTVQSVEITGSGDLHARALESSTAEVTVLGSGNAEVWASDTLSIQVMGSGNVRYRGTPSVNSIVTGSGGVERTETDS